MLLDVLGPRSVTLTCPENTLLAAHLATGTSNLTSDLRNHVHACEGKKNCSWATDDNERKTASSEHIGFGCSLIKNGTFGGDIVWFFMFHCYSLHHCL